MTCEYRTSPELPKRNEIQHSMKRRSRWHDYSRKGTYMLTLVVEGRRPILGKLAIEIAGQRNSPEQWQRSARVDEAEQRNCPEQWQRSARVDEAEQRNCPEQWQRKVWVELSALGKAIQNEEIPKISQLYPTVEIWKTCIMPDHIHMIMRVNEDMPSGVHIGKIIAGFKMGCGSVASKLCGETNRLFEAGYNDKILLEEGQLDNWKAYLDDNPRRLWLKKQNPQLFTVLQNLDIAGRKCRAVGNIFLLDIPVKRAVVVHRRYTEEENDRLREEWLQCAEQGGVLISAAISPKEKEILREAMNYGYKIILLRENGFPELYKPTGESFDACAEGRLLQISPWDYHMERKTISREQCLELNAMAERIAEGTGL